MPWSKNLAFTDPFPCQAAIQAADVELLPTTKGNFEAEITQVRMSRLWMQRFHVNLPHVSAVRMTSGRVALAFLTDDDQSAMQHCGREVSSGYLIVNNFDVVHQRFGSDIRYGSMSLTLGELNSSCKALTGREFSGDKRVIRPNPELLSRLKILHATVGQLAKTTPEILELPEPVQAIEQQLVHLMIRCLSDGTSTKISDGVRRHDMIVTRFEEYLEANSDRPLYLTEVCAALGTAERTLRSACEEHLGMGPIRYLTLRRMHLVRRALLCASSSTATVTQIVSDHGFWELGRFAVQYKVLFGESPSMTLQRPPDDRKIFLYRPSSLPNTGLAAPYRQ